MDAGRKIIVELVVIVALFVAITMSFSIPNVIPHCNTIGCLP
jgi:hypothetical protein